MKNIAISALIFLASLHTEAAVLTGQFDWSGDTYYSKLVEPSSGTATFTYDTTANSGEVSGLLNSFGVYSGNGLWQFSINQQSTWVYLGNGTFQLSQTNLPINSFNDLINFAYVGYWNFAPTGGINRGSYDGTTFSATDAELFNPPFVQATFSNIIQIVPEPSALMLLLTAILLIIYRIRVFKRLKNA